MKSLLKKTIFARNAKLLAEAASGQAESLCIAMPALFASFASFGEEAENNWLTDSSLRNCMECDAPMILIKEDDLGVTHDGVNSPSFTRVGKHNDGIETRLIFGRVVLSNTKQHKPGDFAIIETCQTKSGIPYWLVCVDFAPVGPVFLSEGKDCFFLCPEMLSIWNADILKPSKGKLKGLWREMYETCGFQSE